MAQGLKIRAKTPLWRCGVFHPAEPRGYPIERFTADQVTRLRAEPRLVVEDVLLPDPEPVPPSTPPASSAPEASAALAEAPASVDPEASEHPAAENAVESAAPEQTRRRRGVR